MKQEHIEKDLSEIRRMMEESSQILSLSGMSGISIGIVALISYSLAHFYRFSYLPSTNYADIYSKTFTVFKSDAFIILMILAIVTIVLSLFFGAYFTYRRNKMNFKEIVQQPNTKKFISDLFIPLLIGGILCLISVYHNYYLLIAPFTLLFYGLALINAGKFAIPEIRQLGLVECVLGILAFSFFEYDMIIWALGFGVMHILFGIRIYMRHDR